MSAPLTHYRTLEAAAERALLTPPDPAAGGESTWMQEDDPGPHCRLMSAFVGHPLLQRSLALPSPWLFLLAWLAAAVAHRMAAVPQPWGDEAFTWSLAEGTRMELFARLGEDLHPPLYFWLVQLAAQAGASFESVRLGGYLLSGLGLGLLPLLLQAWPRRWRELASLLTLVLVLFPLDLYFLQLRYYGLLAVLLGGAVIALGNSCEAHVPETQRARWRWASAGLFLLATLANYQAWLVWGLAVGGAWLLRRKNLDLLPPMIGMVGALGLTLWFWAMAGVALGAVAGQAGGSPFASGFANVALETLARLGVLALALFHSEFAPLWGIVLIWLLVGLWWWQSTRVWQSALSPTARLCLGVGGGATLVMAMLTSSVVPVGVEFFPARLSYVLPLLGLGLGEWVLRRTQELRWLCAIGIMNLVLLAGGLDAVTRGMQTPAPAPGAPFLHATYCFPTPGIGALLHDAHRMHPEEVTVLVEDASAQIALEEAGIPVFALLELAPDLESRLAQLTMFPEWYVILGTRDLTPAGERAALEAWLSDHAELQESWQFLHEDPLWLWAKQRVLRRAVEPYKREVRRYRIKAD